MAEKKTTTKKAPAKKTTATKSTTKRVKKEVAVEKKHVLYVASEAAPFAGTGGLGEVIGSLPQAINSSPDIEARIIIPLYQSLSAEDRAKLTFITNITVPVAWRNQYCGLFRYEQQCCGNISICKI